MWFVVSLSPSQFDGVLDERPEISLNLKLRIGRERRRYDGLAEVPSISR